MENDRAPYKRQVFYAPKWQLNRNSRDGVLSKCAKKCILSVKLALCLVLR